MSERLDDRIRALYAELTNAAPELPALPVAKRAPVRSPRVLRPGLMAGAAAVLIAVVGLGALISIVDFAGDDDAAIPATTRVQITAAATTAAPTTAAPTTAAATTSAPTTTTVAAGTTGAPGTTSAPRDPDRILLLAELNLRCIGAIDAFSAEIPDVIATDDGYRAVFTLLFDRLETLRQAVEEANPQLDDTELNELSDRIVHAQGSVVLGGDGPLAPRFPEAVAAVTDLGSLLATFGAVDCGPLGNTLP